MQDIVLYRSMNFKRFLENEEEEIPLDFGQFKSQLGQNLTPSPQVSFTPEGGFQTKTSEVESALNHLRAYARWQDKDIDKILALFDQMVMQILEEIGPRAIETIQQHLEKQFGQVSVEEIMSLLSDEALAAIISADPWLKQQFLSRVRKYYRDS